MPLSRASYPATQTQRTGIYRSYTKCPAHPHLKKKYLQSMAEVIERSRVQVKHETHLELSTFEPLKAQLHISYVNHIKMIFV